MPQALQILIVEDNPDDAELVLRELRRGGFAPDWKRVDTESAFLDALHPGLDAILSDYEMPQFNGFRALELAVEKTAGVPFIIISGTIGEELAVKAIKKGATDYLLKDRLARLPSAMTHALEQTALRKEREQAEDAMRQSEHKYRHLFESLSDAAFLIDSVSGRIIDSNRCAEKLLKRSRAEILGLNETALFPERDALFRGKLPTATADGQLEGARIASSDGQEVPVRISFAPIELHGRRLVLTLIADVTEQKKLEAQVLRSQRLESIGALASGVAHDLNNILSPILMSTSLLRQDLPREMLDRIASTIDLAAQRGADIVRQVLTFGRGAERGRLILKSAHLINEIVKIATETFPKSIAIESSFSNDLWSIIGDATQLHQIMLNLCINARDAMPHGGVLSVSARNIDIDANYASMTPDAKPGRYVALAVADTGTGIPQSILDKIFDPFFTTKEVGKGTGLGLSTVRGIAKSHNGFVGVKSEPGKGTLFEVFVPASSDAESAPAATEKPPPMGQDELVLVVDDEASIRTVSQAILETHGYRGLSAADGAEALAVYVERRDNVTLVMTDTMMPFIDGIALIRTLKRMTPKLKIIAATGQEEGTRMAELKSLHLSSILTKPFTSNALLHAFHDALHGSFARSE